jgi:hypothetical protein
MDLSDILGTMEDLTPDQDEVDLLQESPRKPSRFEAEEALNNLRSQLPMPEVKAYKSFNPLAQKNGTQFGTPSFSTPKELVDSINEYFFRLYEENEGKTYGQTMPTLSGLASHLNISRKKLETLEDEPVYGSIISAAKTQIEAHLEQIMSTPGLKNVGGIALVLKNGFGWKEKQEVSGEMTFSVTRTMFSDPQDLPAINYNPETETENA